MAISGTRQAAAEVLLTLDRASRTPLRAQLERELRELIRSGTLPAGSSMPSTRTLAGDLGVSRRLVVEAYEQLSAEGYLHAHERSATRVASVTEAGKAAAPDEPPAPRFDLRPGVPSLADFPRKAWIRATTDALRNAPDAALAYPDPRGSPALRSVLAEYLRRVRAVAAEPQRIVICTGFRQALSLLTGVLGTPSVAVEDPGMIDREHTIIAAGGTPIAVEVDEQGLRVDQLTEAAADAVLVAPAHQFPLGVTLAPSRRAQLLDWAQAGGLIIEDDYDAEFRYDRQPVGALHGLAPERVVYVGTTSKTLAPALRIGWMVLTCSLLEPITQAKHDHDSGSPTIDQLALAHMIESGAYERHLRWLRRHYRQRRDRLVDALHRHLPDLRVGGTAAGLHLTLDLPAGVDAESVSNAARQRDLALAPIDRYVLTSALQRRETLVIGYGNIPTPAVEEAVRRLSQAIADADGH